MGKFISDEEMSAIEAGSPKNKQFISDEEMSRIETLEGKPAVPSEKPGYTESLLKGIAGGFSGQFIDEAEGGLSAINPFTDKTYEERRDEVRATHKAAEKENPLTYLTGEIIGGTAGLGKLKPFAGMAKNVLTQGLVYGAGKSEGEDPLTVVKDAAISGAGGLAAYGLVKGAGTALNKMGISDKMKKIGNYLEQKARDRAFKQITRSPKLSEVEKLQNLPALAPELRAEGASRLDEAGKHILDTSLKPWSTTSSLVKKARIDLTRAGEEMGAVQDALDDRFPAILKAYSVLNDLPPGAHADKIRAAVSAYPTAEKFGNAIKEIGDEFALDPNLEDLAQFFYSKADAYYKRGSAPVPFSQAKAWHDSLNERIRGWGSSTLKVDETNHLMQRISLKLRDLIDDGIEKHGSAFDRPELMSRWREAKRLYGVNKKIHELGEHYLESRSLRNRFVTPSDYGSGGAAGIMGAVASGSPMIGASTALAGAAANQLGRAFGNSIAASSLRAGSRGVEKGLKTIPNVLQKIAPAAPIAGSALSSKEDRIQFFKDYFGSKKFREAQ